MNDIEYYVKEITAPLGYQVDSEFYKIDTSQDNVLVNVSDYPIGYQENSNKDELVDTNQEDNEKIEDVQTGDTTGIIFIICFFSIVLVLFSSRMYRKNIFNNRV